MLAGDCVALGDTELPYAPIVAALRGLERDEVEAIAGPAARRARAAAAPARRHAGAATVERARPGPAVRAAAGAARRARGRRRAAAAGDRGPALGRPLDARLPRVPDPHRAPRADRARGHLPHRRAASPPPAAPVPRRGRARARGHPRWRSPRFTREELRAQLEGILGQRPEARLVDDLFARAEGNPFYTEELRRGRRSAARERARHADDAHRGAQPRRAGRPADGRDRRAARPPRAARARCSSSTPDALIARAARGGRPPRARAGPGHRRVRVPARPAARGDRRRPAAGRARSAARARWRAR